MMVARGWMCLPAIVLFPISCLDSYCLNDRIPPTGTKVGEGNPLPSLSGEQPIFHELGRVHRLLPNDGGSDRFTSQNQLVR